MKGSSFWVRLLTVSILLVGLGALGGCESAPTAQRAQSGTGTETRGAADQGVLTDTTYRPGDKITIEFDNGLPTPWIQVLREDGTIGLPLNKSVMAAGKRKAQLEEEIRKIFVPNILNRLTVNVRSDDRSYFVKGEVRNPGQKPHTGLITAMKAIAAAGDFTDFAKRSDVEIIRSNGEVIHMNANKALKNPARFDVPVYPGDTVHVNRRFF
jgi:polysaccharide biosynthesis/export protein VpsN